MNQEQASTDIVVTVLMPRAMHADIKSFAKSRGLSLAAFMRQSACDARDRAQKTA